MLLIVKFLSQNVKLYVDNLFVMGNVQRLFLLNQNVNLFVKIQPINLWYFNRIMKYLKQLMKLKKNI